LGYETRATDYTISSTTVSGADDIFSNDITFTADGTSTYWIEFYATRIVYSPTTGHEAGLYLVDGSGTAIGCIGLFNQPSSQAGLQHPVHIKAPYVPASGSITINLRGKRNHAGNYTLSAASGGTGTYDFVNMWLAVYGPE
jgi:hypothetical protein